MTEIVIKINCGDSNTPILGKNLPFLKNISGLPFSLTVKTGQAFLSRVD